MIPTYEVKQTTRDGIEVVTLVERETAQAEIAPALGNNCFSFRTGTDVLEPVPLSEFRQKPTAYGIPILFPFPNRIRDGAFNFRGKEYRIEPPRHGFVRDKPWEVLGYGADDQQGAWLTSLFDAALYPEQILRQFPFPFRLEVTYRLKNGALGMETSARNTGGETMPVGFGLHPYFRKPNAGSIVVPAAARWELRDSLPTGEVLPVAGTYDLRAGKDLAGLSLDDIFTGIVADTDDNARCALRDLDTNAETVVEFPAKVFRHVVVYTPPAPRRAICIEPNSCPTDAFNLHARGVNHADVIELAAGAAAQWRVRFYTRAIA